MEYGTVNKKEKRFNYIEKAKEHPITIAYIIINLILCIWLGDWLFFFTATPLIYIIWRVIFKGRW